MNPGLSVTPAHGDTAQPQALAMSINNLVPKTPVPDSTALYQATSQRRDEQVAQRVAQEQAQAAEALRQQQVAKAYHAAPVQAQSTSSSGVLDLAQSLAAARGWTGQQWNDLVLIGNAESGWNPNALNPSSGACGIPQALPCSKIADHSVTGQITWMLDYIANRYGSPSQAWAFWQAHHWY